MEVALFFGIITVFMILYILLLTVLSSRYN